MDPAIIEEQNKLRIKMGLAPLPVPGAAPPSISGDEGEEEDLGSTIDSRQAESYENYRRVQAAEAEKRARADRAAALRKQIDKQKLSAKLDGSGLGEVDEVDGDAKSWLKAQKKRQKQIEKARKMEEERAEAEAQAAAALEYGGKDLAGLRVAHDMAGFTDDVGEQILTLKDATIDQLEEDGDELENLEMREEEKLQERLKAKKGPRAYNPLDLDDGLEKAGLLSQYDEEIYGKKKERFTLDSNGAAAVLDKLLDGEEPKEKKLQSTGFDIDMIDGTGNPSSDYLDISKIKVKKPKKSKKSKKMRQRDADNDDLFAEEPTDSMDIDATPSKKRKTISADLDDDEDLQAALSRQRRDALKKRKKVTAEEIAKQVREEAEQELHIPEEGTGLVIGEVSEFVSSIGTLQDEVKKPKKKAKTTDQPQKDEDGDAQMADEQVAYGEYNFTSDPSQLKADAAEEEEQDALLEEKTVAQGMGATLALMRERGILKEGNSAETHAKLRQKDEFSRRKAQMEADLEAQARSQRERDRTSGKLNRMSAREREDYARHQNEQRDRVRSQKLSELYKEFYQPTFDIKYIDEDGRRLNTKEAFKQMSHAFHGKGSGKAKTELKMKKIEEEKRREAQSVLDASRNVNMSSVTAQQLEKRKEAGVRLA